MVQLLERQKAQVSPDSLYQLALGFAGTKVLLVARRLGVFEALAELGKTAAELARQLNLPVPSAEMLLDACAALKLLQKNGFVYTNSPVVGAYLIPGKKGYLGRFLDHFNDHMYPAWLHLEEAVRTGHAQIQRVIGQQDDHFFQAIDHQQQDLETFMLTMEEHSVLEGEALADHYDFSRHRVLLDVAGGTGAMSAAILQKHPALKAVVFDRPPVCEITERQIANKGLQEGIRIVPGDVFKDRLPEGADIALLSGILHNWDDAHATLILQQCAAALPQGALLLINEQLLNEEKTGPVPAALCSLNMLVMMEGASERSVSEYELLLQAANFKLQEIRPTGSIRQLLIAQRL